MKMARQDCSAFQFSVSSPPKMPLKPAMRPMPPIRTMADLKGLKLRAPTRQTSRMLAALGATPVAMPVPQVSEALSKGVIDGAVVPYEVVPSVKIQEIVKYHSETDPGEPALYTATFMFVMNKVKYDGLAPELKKVIDNNSGIEFSAMAGRVQEGDDAPGREKTKASGVTINVIPAAELAKWKKATDALDDEWMANMTKAGHDGPKLFKASQDLIKKYTK